MKKHLILFMIFSLMCAAGFSEEMNGNDSDEKGEESLDVSTLNINFLEHTPKNWNFTSYQNQLGESLSYKEVNALLLSVPENKQLIRRHRIWNGTAWTFVGILLASIVTDVVYTCVDGLPHESAVLTASLYTGLYSLSFCMLSRHFSTTQYLRAVDNYNKQFIK